MIYCGRPPTAPHKTEDCTWNLYYLTMAADVPARTGVNTPMIFTCLNADPERIEEVVRIADANRELRIEQYGRGNLELCWLPLAFNKSIVKFTRFSFL